MTYFVRPDAIHVGEIFASITARTSADIADSPYEVFRNVVQRSRVF